MFRQKRLSFCFSILFIIFSLFIVRLFQIQIFKHKYFVRQVKKQYICYERSETLRGMIFDRNGSNLVLSKEVDSCVAWPKQIKDKYRAIKQLDTTLELDEAEIKNKIYSKNNFVWLKRKISPAESEKVANLELEGVALIKEGKRFYPEGDLLWHLLGRVNVDNQGVAGLELAYNNVLRGSAFNELKARDAAGRRIDLVNPSTAAEEKKASNLILTIDKQIQHIAERELGKIFEETRAKKATLLVQDIKSGEILAWACSPTYEEDAWRKNPLFLSNPALNETIEPGSTFKVIAAAFALDENITNPKEKYDCENGLFKLHGVKIRDHEKRGILTFSEVIGYSSNIGMAKLGLRFNRQKFYQYIYNFGFGSPTGINLPGESPGIFDTRRSKFAASAVSLPILCYGQGIGVTALQLVTAYSAVANGGLLMEPQVVKEIRDEKDKVVWQAEPVVIRRVVSEKSCRILQEMLEGVVEWGTGTSARIKGYRIAGKTGTSQKFEPLTGKYSDSRHTASFCGFFPLPDPKWTILVILDEPQTGNYWGGTTAAPVFGRVAEQMLNYFRILPENNKYAQIEKTP